MFAFVVLGLVFFSVLLQEIGLEERLRNDPILCQVGHKTLTQKSNAHQSKHCSIICSSFQGLADM